MSRPFHFKQFSISQENAAMKVGFDGVILGAWCNVTHSSSCLDLGTSTGLLALMMAQRNAQAKITAIEIDAESCTDAQLNFEQSAFAHRLKLVQTDFLQWNSEETYAHIVSNPPFFIENTIAAGESRSKARQAQHFPLQAWLPKAKELLAKGGKISFIYPSKEKSLIMRTASAVGLHLHRECWIKSNPDKLPHRILVELRLTAPLEMHSEEMCIRQSSSNNYHNDHISLCRDFYLHM
ncbi:MAG: tRNA1(Val) (adenine(37)-N6)-methyltransferase [Mangrovibacterium sp.]